MIDFDNPILVAHFGTWMKVQVAFYDYLFQKGSTLCPKHFNETLMSISDFAEGRDFYDTTVRAIVDHYPSSTTAWSDFLTHCHRKFNLPHAPDATPQRVQQS